MKIYNCTRTLLGPVRPVSSCQIGYSVIDRSDRLGRPIRPVVLVCCQFWSSTGSSLAPSCNIRLFIIELDYDYRYLVEVCSDLSDIYFVIWLHYHTMLALHDRPVIAMANILALKLWQLLQYSYVCSSVMSVHPEGGGSAPGH